MFERDDADAGRLRIKICGITNAEDARAAIECGADALGFNCYARSKRYVDLAAAGAWIYRLPAGVRRIAIVVDPAWEEAIALAALPFVDALQLHGSESEEFCARLAHEGISFGKALPAFDATLLAKADAFSTSTVVLDSTFGSHFGGTGTTFPWSIANRFAREHPSLQLVLAGGLTPENVGQAVAAVRPFAVDVTSGVELSPGRKDDRLLHAFIKGARAA